MIVVIDMYFARKKMPMAFCILVVTSANLNIHFNRQSSTSTLCTQEMQHREENLQGKQDVWWESPLTPSAVLLSYKEFCLFLSLAAPLASVQVHVNTHLLVFKVKWHVVLHTHSLTSQVLFRKGSRYGYVFTPGFVISCFSSITCIQLYSHPQQENSSHAISLFLKDMSMLMNNSVHQAVCSTVINEYNPLVRFKEMIFSPKVQTSETICSISKWCWEPKTHTYTLF